jgi:hypothetical protein
MHGLPRALLYNAIVSIRLDDIINLAIDGKQPLPDILRKCLLLGHELKNERLKEWANKELSGYKSIGDIPAYRHMHGIAQGARFMLGGRNLSFAVSARTQSHTQHQDDS